MRRLEPRSIATLVLWSSLAAGGSAARADAPAAAEDPVLAALVAEALERNPDLLASREAAAAARARSPQARSLPDPMVSLLFTNDGWSPSLGSRDMTTLGVMASQPLPFPGKLRLRGEIASLEANQVEQQAERTRLGVVASVRRAYYDLLQARQLLELAEEQAEIWREIEGVARARYSVGQGAQQDVLRVQVEMTRIGQLQAEQEAEAQARLAELNRLLDRPQDASVETTARLGFRPSGRDLPEELDRARTISPELRSARLSVEREGRAVALARRDFKPDLTVQAGYMNRGGLDAMWQAGVAITLPIHRSRLTAAVSEAQAQLKQREHLRDAVEAQLRFRTQERVAQRTAAERIATLYEKGIVPQDRMSVESAIANYQVGKVPFVAVLEALTTLYGDRSTHLRLLAGRARIEARLAEASLEATSDLGVLAMPGGPSLSQGSGGAGGQMTSGAMGAR